MPSTRSKQPAPEPEQQLIWPLRMAVGIWQGLGHLVGGALRRMGTDVSDIPAHDRRDGSGLFFILLATIIATFEWWGLDGPLANAVHGVFQGTFGWFAAMLPPMLLIFSILVFRQPTNIRSNNRVAIGFTAMILSGCALAHVAGGMPSATDGFDRVSAAGGMVGLIAAGPFNFAAPVLPVAIFSILAFFSLLILTATPIRHIPDRLRGLYEMLVGSAPAPHLDADGHDQSYLYDRDAAAAAKKPRALRGRKKAEAEAAEAAELAYDGDTAFETALV
ncbi:MAG: DNA translocase FtsK, partial [Specibacter sp.]